MSRLMMHISFDFTGGVVALCLIPFLLVTSGFSADRKTADAHTIVGTWKFNLRNSNMANLPAPQQATLLVSTHGNTLTWRETGVGGNGNRFDYIFNGLIDGRPYPLKGASSHVTVSFIQKQDSLVGKWKGHGKRLSTAKVSADGKSLTVENVSNVYNMVSNWVTSWDRVPSK